MAIPVNISDLINHRIVESNRIEFKSDWNPEPILHTICAFANDIDNMGGGYIVIGVEEKDGVPVLPVKGIEMNRINNIEKNFTNAVITLNHIISLLLNHLFMKTNIFLSFGFLEVILVLTKYQCHCRIVVQIKNTIFEKQAKLWWHHQKKKNSLHMT